MQTHQYPLPIRSYKEMNLKEYSSMEQEIRALRQLAASQAKKLTPEVLEKGGVCMALDNGSTCDNKPEFELFVPSVSMKPFVLCREARDIAIKTFTMLGIFFQVFDHNRGDRQKTLF